MKDNSSNKMPIENLPKYCKPYYDIMDDNGEILILNIPNIGKTIGTIKNWRLLQEIDYEIEFILHLERIFSKKDLEQQNIPIIDDLTLEKIIIPSMKKEKENELLKEFLKIVTINESELNKEKIDLEKIALITNIFKNFNFNPKKILSINELYSTAIKIEMEEYKKIILILIDELKQNVNNLIYDLEKEKNNETIDTNIEKNNDLSENIKDYQGIIENINNELEQLNQLSEKIEIFKKKIDSTELEFDEVLIQKIEEVAELGYIFSSKGLLDFAKELLEIDLLLNNDIDNNSLNLN